MIVVLDPSAAVEILLKRNNSTILQRLLIEAETVISPDLYIAEISNVAWKYYKLAKYSHEQTISLAEDGINLIDTFIPTNELWKESLREAINNDHPVYDCLYAVCARRTDGVLLTMDERLKALSKELKIDIR
ncbi:type II toxin-antitoxin system VapC family toxin [Sediminispirochaeta smaragdinae]|uniref:PilT protein domain protein n=1 Tax=Sediminispirochaeta smaragdinae (strain DSM 11293 / JCM 15392 / SEBR 4228) TaxID=573413 RepID=E1R4K3_SEDSS|nr:type II toxin-antitoxin system VapC family toxin [Sediminispirochaeta smaragdinae]ADK81744.1 PilT protein domain protein [Sediminispirochaeta smaragdinae DSM 11293]